MHELFTGPVSRSHIIGKNVERLLLDPIGNAGLAAQAIVGVRDFTVSVQYLTQSPVLPAGEPLD